MKRHARTFGAALVLAAACTSSFAYADDPPVVPDSAAEARSQYQMGTQAFQAKRYSEAALHFESAASFRSSAVALYTAGLAWDLASKPERAADAYQRSLEVGSGLDAKQVGLAKDRVAQLEKTLGTVAVTAPDGWKVQLDSFSEVPTPARLHGSPGVRALSVRVPGRATIEHRDVALEAGKVSTIELKDEPKDTPKEPEAAPQPDPAPVAPMAPAHENYWTTRRVVGVGVGGVGIAALGGAIILGLSANGAKDAYDAGPTRSSFDHASSLQTWTNVTLVTGALLLAGGVALVVWPERDKPEGRLQVSAAPGGAAVGGSF